MLERVARFVWTEDDGGDEDDLHEAKGSVAVLVSLSDC